MEILDAQDWFEIPVADTSYSVTSGVSWRLRLRSETGVYLSLSEIGSITPKYLGWAQNWDVILRPGKLDITKATGKRCVLILPVDDLAAGIAVDGAGEEVYTDLDRMPNESGALSEVQRALRLLKYQEQQMLLAGQTLAAASAPPPAPTPPPPAGEGPAPTATDNPG